MAYRSTYEQLTDCGFTAEQPLNTRKMVSVEEKGKRYTLVIEDSKESVVYAVDGYIIKDSEGLRCDKLVLVKSPIVDKKSEQWAEIFIELKGTDIKQAISQLRVTLQNPIFKHPSNNIVRARIVAQSFPSNKSNPIMYKAKQEFLKNYNCELRGMKNGQNDKL